MTTQEFKIFELVRNEINRRKIKNEPYKTENGLVTKYFDAPFVVTLYTQAFKDQVPTYHIQVKIKYKKEWR